MLHGDLLVFKVTLLWWWVCCKTNCYAIVDPIYLLHYHTIIRWLEPIITQTKYSMFCTVAILKIDWCVLPVSIMMGHVFMLTVAAASLDLRIFVKTWVVRMQAALLTWGHQERDTRKLNNVRIWLLKSLHYQAVKGKHTQIKVYNRCKHRDLHR